MMRTNENNSMKKRVLVVLEAHDVFPSGFVRGLIYKDYFKSNGFEAKYVNHVFPPFVRLLDNPPAILKPLMYLGLGRLLVLLLHLSVYFNENNIARIAKNYDVVYMSKVSSFRLVNKLHKKVKARLVLDFGDALWLSNRVGKIFNDILKLVDAVTTDNELTAAYVRKWNPNCTVIPDCPQVEWFDKERSKKQSSGNKITLGWLGRKEHLYNLYVVWEALEWLFSKYQNIHLRLVGIGTDLSRLPPFEKIRYSYRSNYSQSEMIEEVLSMDIGLVPLQDIEASLVRGILKGTVYMAGEACVVCSPVGQYRDLIQDGVNGLWASSPKEWYEKIERLINNPELRFRISQAGLETVRKNFTVDKSFTKLCTVLYPNKNGK